MKLTFEVPFPNGRLATNRTPKSAIVAGAIRKRYKEQCAMAIRAQLSWMRLDHGVLPLRHCRCQYEFRRYGVNRQDSDNAIHFMKGAMDAFQLVGVIENDRYVEYDDPIWKTEGASGRVVFVTFSVDG